MEGGVWIVKGELAEALCVLDDVYCFLFRHGGGDVIYDKLLDGKLQESYGFTGSLDDWSIISLIGKASDISPHDMA